MEKEKNESAAIKALREKKENNAKKPDFGNDNKTDLKDFFAAYMKDDQNEAEKTIRILPSKDPDKDPYEEVWVHKIKLDNIKNPVKYLCLDKNFGHTCPFCEKNQEYRNKFAVSKIEEDKTMMKKFFAGKTYVCKVVDRNFEEEGVKFWRFNHDFRNQGTFDKLFDISSKKGEIWDSEKGRDLTIYLKRDQNRNIAVSSILPDDISPLSENKEKMEAWLADDRTWHDMYKPKDYEYLEIVANTFQLPVWDKSLNNGEGGYRARVEEDIKPVYMVEPEEGNNASNAPKNDNPPTSSTSAEDDLPF